MKISKIEIKNFRSLHDVTIYPNSILTLVGRNNSGKSNITKALALFFDPSTKNIDSECFYNHKTDKPIQITLTFEKLSGWENEQFKAWMDGEKLVVGREIVCKSEEEFEIIEEIDPNNKVRTAKNILSKKHVTKWELDEIFS